MPRMRKAEMLSDLFKRRCERCGEMKPVDDFVSVVNPGWCRKCSREEAQEFARREMLKYKKLSERQILTKVKQAIYMAVRRKCPGMSVKELWSILPYTPEDLKKHIESLFEPGMCWENHGLGPGTWQIDYVRPIKDFDIRRYNIQELRRCLALENLRPLWHKEHRKKTASERRRR